MPLPLGSVGPPRRGCHLLRELQPHTLPGPGDLDPLLLALPVPGWVTHGPAPACCQPEPRSSEGPQGPTAVAGGCGHCPAQAGARTCPPQETDWGTPQHVDLGTKRPNFRVMWPLAKPAGANRCHQLQCLSCVTGGPGGVELQGDPEAWSAAGGASLGTQCPAAAAHCGEASWPWGRCVSPHCVGLP